MIVQIHRGRLHVRLEPWLTITTTKGTSGIYQHRLVSEEYSQRPLQLPTLKEYVNKAHEDARNRMRKAFRGTLDPFGTTATADPARGYPEKLHITNLKGFFGEILAARFAEFGEPHGTTGWHVPAYPYRNHDAAITRILEWQKTGNASAEVPGQVGDDCVAFLRDSDGSIIKCLVCEAKCTKSNNSSLVHDAHVGVSSEGIAPPSVWRIAETLDQMGDPESVEWAGTIRRDILLAERPTIERYDLVMYVYGNAPKREKTWICTDRPHAAYSGGRMLHAVEVCFRDVEQLIKDTYDASAAN